jgi:hypothetical protein
MHDEYSAEGSMDEVKFVSEGYRYLTVAHHIAKTMLENDLRAGGVAVLASKLQHQQDYRVRGLLPWRSAWPNLTVRLESLKHRFPLSLILPKVPEEMLLFRILLANPLQAPLYKPLDVGGS